MWWSRHWVYMSEGGMLDWMIVWLFWVVALVASSGSSMCNPVIWCHSLPWVGKEFELSLPFVPWWWFDALSMPDVSSCFYYCDFRIIETRGSSSSSCETHRTLSWFITCTVYGPYWVSKCCVNYCKFIFYSFINELWLIHLVDFDFLNCVFAAYHCMVPLKSLSNVTLWFLIFGSSDTL